MAKRVYEPPKTDVVQVIDIMTASYGDFTVSGNYSDDAEWV